MSTESVPPRKPRGARRWPWMVVAVGALAAAYVGTYVALRQSGEIRFKLVWAVGQRRAVLSAGSDHSLSCSLFRPCVEAERWWRRDEVNYAAPPCK